MEQMQPDIEPHVHAAPRSPTGIATSSTWLRFVLAGAMFTQAANAQQPIGPVRAPGPPNLPEYDTEPFPPAMPYYAPSVPTVMRSHEHLEFNDPVLQKRMQQTIKKMGNDDYQIREKATQDVLSDVLRIQEHMYPLPDWMTDMTKHRYKDLEIHYRMKAVDRLSERVAPLGTIVPLTEKDTGSTALQKLEMHGRVRITFKDPLAQEILFNLKMDPSQNSFAEILRAVGMHTGTVPHINTNEHFRIDMRPAEHGEILLIEESFDKRPGSLIGVYTPPSLDEDGKAIRGSLRIVPDPNSPPLALASAKNGPDTEKVEVTLDLYQNPLWKGMKGVSKPKVTNGRLSYVYGKTEPSHGNIGIQVGTMTMPYSVDFPAKQLDTQSVGPFNTWLEPNDNPLVHTLHLVYNDGDDNPIVHWEESYINALRVELLNEHGEAIPGTMEHMTCEFGGNNEYCLEIRSSAPFATLRVHGYREMTHRLLPRKNLPLRQFAIPTTP